MLIVGHQGKVGIPVTGGLEEGRGGGERGERHQVICYLREFTDTDNRRSTINIYRNREFMCHLMHA